MNVRTNTLQKYIDVFGEDTLIKAIKKSKSIKSPGSVIEVTNPIMRFLMNTTYEKNGKLYTHKDLRVPPEDYSYFRMVSAILSDIKPEIEANESYKKQLAEKILHSQSGPMLSAMNEILVAAYYKYLGIKVALNSSAQEGVADIDLGELPFATDTKTYPNNRLLLEAIVNDSAQEIVDAVKLVRNQGLLIWVLVPNKKQFKKSLKALAKAFEDKTIGQYRDDTISVTIIDNDYPGADFHINVQPQNVNVFFQANWDMAPSIEEVKGSIEKAVKQAKALSKQAIPWIMVPRDASRNGIEVQMLRFVAKFHEYVFNHKDIFAMPVYSLEFEGNGVSTIFDIYQTGENTFKINAPIYLTDPNRLAKL
jgi:uncharacterized protein YdaT